MTKPAEVIVVTGMNAAEDAVAFDIARIDISPAVADLCTDVRAGPIEAGSNDRSLDRSGFVVNDRVSSEGSRGEGPMPAASRSEAFFIFSLHEG
jgi:hypothetical protein